MDVDSEGSGNNSIESSLLQQFSCMVTTDRDELVQQLQKLLGSHMNYATAVFFLDMNNWNLQAAVCSYLDVESSNKLPSMALMADPIANEVESIEPNMSFQKSWQIYNNGQEDWPPGCYAQCSDGAHLGGGQVRVPCLKPGESMHLSVNMRSPLLPGTYQSKWRLCTENGAYFGDPMWAILTVVEEGTMALTNQLSHFNELGSLPPVNTTHNPFLPHRQQEQADASLHKDSSQDQNTLSWCR